MENQLSRGMLFGRTMARPPDPALKNTRARANIEIVQKTRGRSKELSEMRAFKLKFTNNKQDSAGQRLGFQTDVVSDDPERRAPFSIAPAERQL